MKKVLIYTITFILTLFTLCGCRKEIDYFEYVSEKRTDVYYYSDDNLTVKMFRSERESPYIADGIKGDVSYLFEVYCYFKTNPESVNFLTENMGGEMNFMSVKNCFYLSFGNFLTPEEKLDFSLTFEQKTATYTATNVISNSTISCEDALKCAIEHDSETFEKLTENGIFNGEIFIRLLYDDGCYYYVGVCDKNKRIHAYLVDGEKGKIIAERTFDN